RNTVIRLRLDVLDIVHRGGERTLEDCDHALFHLFGRKSAVIPHHADHGNVDIRKDIDRHRHDGADTENGDQHCHYNEGIRSPEGESDYPHGYTSSAFGYALGKGLMNL